MSQPVLRNGSKGSSVTLCQQRLNAKGFHVKVDGDFGPSTETVVEQFQASWGLLADGIVGNATWALLMAEGEAATPKDVLEAARAEAVALIPPATNVTLRAVLEAGIAKLGCKEIPDGSNGGPEIAEIVEGVGGDGLVPSAYYLHWGVTDKNVLRTLPPWCALFVCYALRVGLKKSSWSDIPFGKWYGGVAQIEEWAKKNKRWYSPVPSTVPAGSIFTISRGGSGSDAASSASAGHVGLVIRDNGDGTVTTIEGNVSNKVASYTRKKSGLRGVIYWW